MTVTGYKYPTQSMHLSDAPYIDEPWGAISNIEAAAGYADTDGTLLGFERSYYLIGFDFDFAIPVGSTINNINVRTSLAKSGNGATQTYAVLRAVLSCDSTPALDNITDPEPDTMTSSFVTFSDNISPSGLDVSDINSTGFGIAIGIQCTQALGVKRRAECEWIQCQIDYTAPAGISIPVAQHHYSKNIRR